MTMKYTHIGLDDQAQALAKLRGFAPASSEPQPAVAESVDEKPEPKS
jgi:hypothetical protein